MGKKEIFSTEELYEQYWRCRDFELSHLWQRSVFLTAFLVLCFSGYGYFFGKIFVENMEINFFLKSNPEGQLIGIFISTIGIVLSILYVAMAKASKAWYEVYEQAITAIDTQPGFFRICNFLSVKSIIHKKSPSRAD